MNKLTASIATVVCTIICLSGCQLSSASKPMKRSKAPTVAYQDKPKWLSQLKSEGIDHQFHRQHLELRLPVAEHFSNDAELQAHLQKALAPIAKQLAANHYQLAEVQPMTDNKRLSPDERTTQTAQVNAVINALKTLQVDEKFLVAKQAKRRKPREKNQQTHGPYIAVNLYQAHQGHGLVY